MSDIFRPRRLPTPEAEAYQQQSAANQAVVSQANEQDFILQQQREQAAAQKAQEEAAAEAARAQKQALTAAKRAGVQTEVDATGQESIKTHEDGAPLYEAGFQGSPTISDNGATATYRDARGQRFGVPLDAIRNETDPTGAVFHTFDAQDATGNKVTHRQPAGTKPLFRVDPGTGSRIVDTTDPKTGSVIPQIVGIDPAAASTAAIAKRKAVFEQQQEERKFQHAELGLRQNQQETLLRPIQDRLKAAQDAADKLAKSKERYEQGPDGYAAVTELPDGNTYRTPIDTAKDAPMLAKAQAWLEQKKRTESELAAAKAEHDPLAAEVFGMQKQRDELALQTLRESRRVQIELERMEAAAKAGQPVYLPDWQQRAQTSTDRERDLIAQAGLDESGDPLAADVRRVAIPEAAAAINRAMSSMLNNGLDLLNAGMGGKQPTLLEAIQSDLATNNPAKPGDYKNAQAIAMKSLGIADPARVQVEQRDAAGRPFAMLKVDGEDYASLDLENNRLTLIQTQGSLRDKGAEIVANASQEGVPVFMVSSSQPFNAADLRDLIQGGIEAVQGAKTQDEAAANLQAAGLSADDIRKQVMEGKLSVQDGRMLAEKFHGIAAVNSSRGAVEAELGKWLESRKTDKAEWQAGNKAEVINRFMDSLAGKAVQGVAADRLVLEERRRELMEKHAPESTASKMGGFVKELIMPMVGIGAQAVAFVPQKLAKWSGYETEAGRLSEQQFEDWQKRTGSFINKMMSRDDVVNSLGELRSLAATASPGEEVPADMAERIAKIALEGYHELTPEAQKNLGTSVDTFNINRDPALRAAWNRYLNTADPAAFSQLESLLMMDARDRKTQAEVSAYISAPRVSGAGDVIGRAKGLGLDLTPEQAGKLFGITRVMTRADEKGASNLIREAAGVLGLPEAEAADVLQRVTADVTDDPDSAWGLLKGGFVAGRQELLTEVASTAVEAGLAWVSAGAATPEIIAERAARQAAKTGIRAAIGRQARAAFAKVLDEGTAFARARAALGAKMNDAAEAFAKAGIKSPTFGQPLTRGDKVRNALVTVGKNAAAAAPVEAIEEGIAAIGEPDPNAASIGEQMLMGAAGGLVLTPMFAGAAGVGQAWKNRGAGAEWEKRKAGYVEELNRRMAAVPGFKPLTVADFDAWQGLQASPTHQQATAEFVAAVREFETLRSEHEMAAAGNATLPVTPELLAAQAKAEAAGQVLASTSEQAFVAMDELRAIPEAERPLYTAAAKAAAGVTDFTEAEAKALMAQSGDNAIAFQQAQVMPGNVAGPPAQKTVDAPAVSTVAPGVYRVPQGTKITLPPALLSMLEARAPSTVGLMGGETMPYQGTSGKPSQPKPKGKKRIAKPNASTQTVAPTPPDDLTGTTAGEKAKAGTDQWFQELSDEELDRNIASVAGVVNNAAVAATQDGGDQGFNDIAKLAQERLNRLRSEKERRKQAPQTGKGKQQPSALASPVFKGLDSGHQAREANLRKAGGDTVTVKTEADAEKLLGRKLSRKGRKAFTARINGKPTVVFIADNIAKSKIQDSHGHMVDHELNHAAVMLAIDANPELMAAAENEAAQIDNGESFYPGFNTLDPTGKAFEAMAALAAGDWKPGQGSKIKSLLEAIIDKLAAVFGVSRGDITSKQVVDALRSLTAAGESILNDGKTPGAAAGGVTAPAPQGTAKPLPAKAIEKVTREAIGRMAAKSPRIKALLKESKRAHRYPTGGMWLEPDGKVSFHVPTIIQQLESVGVTDTATAGKRVEALLDEEIRHSANMVAANRLFAGEQAAGRVLRGMPFETWRDAWYGDIWNNHFTEEMRQSVQAAYGDTLPEADWMRAMEGLRMLDQLRATGSITEAVLQALDAILESLREFLDLVTAGGKQIVEAEIMAIREVLAEYGYEGGAVKPDAKKKPAKVKTPEKSSLVEAPETAPESALSNPDMSTGAVDGVATELPPIEKAPAGSPELAKPTLEDGKHWLFDTQPGDVATGRAGGNLFIIGHFGKMKDAEAAAAEINAASPEAAKVEGWLRKSKREGGKPVSMWSVFIPNVTQDFVDEYNSAKAADQAPKQAPMPEAEANKLRDALRQLRRWKENSDYGKAYEVTIDNYQRGTWTLQDTPPPADTLQAIESETAKARQFWIVQNMQYIEAQNVELAQTLAQDAKVMEVVRNTGNDAQNLRIYLSQKFSDALVKSLRAKIDTDSRFGLFYDYTQERRKADAWLDMMADRLKATVSNDAAPFNPAMPKVGDEVEFDWVGETMRGKISRFDGSGVYVVVDQGGGVQSVRNVSLKDLRPVTPVQQPVSQPAKSAEPSREEQQKTYAKFKRALAKAVKAKDYAEIIRQADAFQKHYETEGNGGFPEQWSDWERHKADAEMQLARQGDVPLRPLVVPVLKPVTPPRPAASEDAAYLKAQEDARAALGGLFSAPARRSIPQLEVPEERFDAVKTAAKSIIAAKIRTPEAFARFMDDTFPGGKARPYSEAIWDVMGIWDKSLRGTHDWSRIYGDIDQPLPDVQEPEAETQPTANLGAILAKMREVQSYVATLQTSNLASDPNRQSKLTAEVSLDGALLAVATGAIPQARAELQRASNALFSQWPTAAELVDSLAEMLSEPAIDETPEIPQNTSDETQPGTDSANPPGVRQVGGLAESPEQAGQPGSARPDNQRPQIQPDNLQPPERGGDSGEVGVSDVRPDQSNLLEGSESTGGEKSGNDGPPASDRGEGSGVAGDQHPQHSPGRGNYHLTDPESIVGGGPKARFNKNKAALELLDILETENREPTPAELDTLAAYTGWGALGQELFQGSFDNYAGTPEWREEAMWLRDRLGKADWTSAQDSILNAHYTDPPTVTSMWDMIRRMGFTGGRVLEPSEGIGNVWSLMPRDLMAKSQLTGIEMDTITASIAKMLHPQVNHRNIPYQKSTTSDNFYDVVLGNWPFSNNDKPADRRWDHLEATVHNFFFLKALAQVRPGGLVVGITSAGTMDSKSSKIRKYLAARGELVAAFRLPSGAFGKYAGTKVVTDLIILRKREQELETDAGDQGWVESKKHPDFDFNINEYYLKNPSHILGKLGFGHGTTYGRAGMIVERQADYETTLARLFERLSENTLLPWNGDNMRDRVINNTTKESRQNTVVEQRGELYTVNGESLTPLDAETRWKTKTQKTNDKRLAEARALIALREAFTGLMSAYQARTDTAAPRAALKAAYDAYVVAHGKLSDSFMLGKFLNAGDPYALDLQALVEVVDGIERPRAIMERDIMRAPKLETQGSINDAYAAQRGNSPIFDAEEVARLAGVTQQEVIDFLARTGTVYKTPTGVWEPGEIYLSGNVRRKLREAEAAKAEGVEGMEPNIEALKKIVPADVPYYAITTQMGAAWIPLSDYNQFVREKLNGRPQDIQISKVSGGYNVRIQGATADTTEARNTYNVVDERGEDHLTPSRIFQAAMNGTALEVKIETRNAQNEKIYIVSPELTKRAMALRDRIRDEFARWVWEDEARAARLSYEYNEAMNSIINAKFDGGHLTMPGLALSLGDGAFDLRKHQLDAIWRGIVNRKGVYAHEVGTGKTFTMAGIAIEGKRQGRHRKPILFAHNANSAAVAEDFRRAYPGARVLYIESLSPAERDLRLRQIASDDWDAVIVPHSLIDRFGLKGDTLYELAQKDIDALESEFWEAAEEIGIAKGSLDLDNSKLVNGTINNIRGADNNLKRTAKELASARRRIVTRIEKQISKFSKPGMVFFEDMGIDAILVDEAHVFKKIALATRKQIKGLNKTESGKGFQLGLLTDWLKRENNGHGVHLFTGTPVTNTLNEVFNMMRFSMHNEMSEQSIDNFDDWYNNYAKGVTDIEPTSGGTWEAVERLRAFLNIPELARLAGQVFDVVRAKDMPEFLPRPSLDGFVPEGQKAIGRPSKSVRPIVIEPPAIQKRVMSWIRQRFAVYRDLPNRIRGMLKKMGGDAPNLMDIDGKNAALDPRLVDPNAEDDPNSKVNTAVGRVLEHYSEHPKATQMVFLERGANDYTTADVTVYGPEGPIYDNDGEKVTRKETRKQFNILRDMVEKLVAQGVKPEEIAVFHNLSLMPLADGREDVLKKVRRVSSGTPKEVIAAMMNKGEIRIAFGGTETMGTGVNAQEWLRAMHHLDVPWMPGELEQRNGRGHRQGNRWNTVFEYRYTMEGTHDGKMWSTLLNKVRFIERFTEMLQGRDMTRTMEGEGADASEEDSEASASDFEQMFSKAAGDPRILLRVKMERDLDKLRNDKQIHFGFIEQARRKSEQIANELPRQEATAIRLETDFNQFKAQTADGFKAELRDKTFTERAEFDEALKRLPMFRDRTKIGKFAGFDLYITPTLAGQSFELVGPNHGSRDGYMFSTPSAASMEGMLRALGKRAGNIRADIDKGRADMEKLRAKMAEPFPNEKALEDQEKAYAVLVREIVASPMPAPGWLRYGAPAGSLIYLRENGKLIPKDVMAHRWDNNGYWILVDMNGEMTPVRYTDALTDEGRAMFEEQEFTEPPQITVNDTNDANGQSYPGVEESLANAFGTRLVIDNGEVLRVPRWNIPPPTVPDGHYDRAAQGVPTDEDSINDILAIFSGLSDGNESQLLSPGEEDPFDSGRFTIPDDPNKWRITTDGWGFLGTGNSPGEAFNNALSNHQYKDALREALRQFLNPPNSAPPVRNDPNRLLDVPQVQRGLFRRREKLRSLANEVQSRLDALEDDGGTIPGYNYGILSERLKNLENELGTVESLLMQSYTRGDEMLLSSAPASSTMPRDRAEAIVRNLTPKEAAGKLTPPEAKAIAEARARIQEGDGTKNRPPTTHVMPDGYELTGPGNHTLASAPARKVAYHGTPHKVDKFTTAKIGTGEGAQAYGWGLYFAESKGVADQYRKVLVQKQKIGKSAPLTAKEDVQRIFLSVGNIEEVKNIVRAEIVAASSNLIEAQRNPDTSDFTEAEANRDLKRWQAALSYINDNYDDLRGNLYTVQLLADESEFLDWDRPLSEQSEKVDYALKTDPVARAAVERQVRSYNPNGDEIYEEMKYMLGGEREASEHLASLGIPGIKYLDAGSRSSGDGTRNYVLFDENLVRILEENGKPVESSPVLASAPARVTPAQDAEYIAAVEAGDMVKAQRMVDAAAKAANYDTSLPLVHHTFRDFTVFKMGGYKQPYGGAGWSGKGVWMEPEKLYLAKKAKGKKPNIAHTHEYESKLAKEKYADTERRMKTLRLYAKILNPVGIYGASGTDFAQEQRDEHGFSRSFPLIITDKDLEILKAKQKDAAFTADENGNIEEVIVFSPEQIKSADPVTRDEAGNVIPLSQRFNPASDSILYSAPARPKSNKKAIEEALSTMPPIWQNVLRDKWAGKDIPDIATARNISEAAVVNVLRMAEGRLRVLMDSAATKPTVQVEDGVVKAVGGRPDLAMAGNAAFAGVDQRRMTSEEVTHAEMNELATRLFAVDPDAAEKLVVRWMDSGTTVLSTDGFPDGIKAIVSEAQARSAAEMLMTAAAKLLVTQKAMQGGNTTQIARLIYLYRNTGTEQARALGMRQDPFDSPAERAAMYLQETLLTPPESMRNELRRNPANRERILAAWAARADKLKAELLAEGIDLDATLREFAKEQELAEATIPEPVKPVLARAPKKTRQLVKALLQGLNPSEAIANAGMNAKAAFAAYKAFRESINQAGTDAAKAMQEQLLRSAPAGDFAASLGLPDLTEEQWLEAVMADKPLRTTPETEKLKVQREKKKEGGELDLKNPLSVNKARRAIEERKSNAFDKMSEFWRASILSGPQTHVVNVVSGLTYGTYEATFKKLATGAQADIARMFGMKPDAASLADIPAMIAATLPAIRAAFLDSIKAWKSETRVFDAYALQLTDENGALFKESFSPALKGTLGKVMRGISFRLMGAADEFVKSFFTRVEVAAQARQIARQEGKSGLELAKAISELLEPGSLAWERSLAQAKKITFQTEIGSGTSSIDSTVDGLATLISRTKKGDFGKFLKGLSHFTFPFVDTPTNIFKQGVTMSPVGGLLALVDATRSLIRRKQGNVEEAERIYNAARALDDLTNQIVAWGFIIGLSELVKPGDDDEELPFITGTIPWRSTSPGEREIAYRTAPPQSIRIGGQWYSYKRLDPFASALAFTVDAIKEMQSGKPMDEAWGNIGLGMLRNMQDKTFLQGVSDLVNAATDPERFGTKWATNIAIGFIPNLIRQPIRTGDDVFRENDLPNDMGFWESLGRRVGFGVYPKGWNGGVLPDNPIAPMPAFDVWGREAAKNTGTGQPTTDWLLRLLSPVETRDADNVDPLDRALLRYNMTHDEPFGVAAPSREIQRTIAGKVVKVSLNDAEYAEFITKAGIAARAAIGGRYTGRDLTEADVETIKDVISKVQAVYRDIAFTRAMRR
jgi:N12 class adenine-specific DNA methylase